MDLYGPVLLNGRKSSLSYLKAFGCKCFCANNDKEILANLIQRIMKEFLWAILLQARHTESYNKRTLCVRKVFMLYLMNLVR